MANMRIHQICANSEYSNVIGNNAMFWFYLCNKESLHLLRVGFSESVKTLIL